MVDGWKWQLKQVLYCYCFISNARFFLWLNCHCLMHSYCCFLYLQYAHRLKLLEQVSHQSGSKRSIFLFFHFGGLSTFYGKLQSYSKHSKLACTLFMEVRMKVKPNEPTITVTVNTCQKYALKLASIGHFAAQRFTTIRIEQSTMNKNFLRGLHKYEI